MTGYYHAKRTAEAKRYLDERDREVAITIVDERRQRSLAWLEKFRASGRASRTGFDWRPRWPLNPPGDDNGKEIIDGEFTVVADADAAGEDSRRERSQESRGHATRPGIEDAQGHAQQAEGGFETPF